MEREVDGQRQAWRQRRDEHRMTFDEWTALFPNATLRDLAQPFAEHPDYREEWRESGIVNDLPPHTPNFVPNPTMEVSDEGWRFPGS